jgi:osmotically-inducible protein OsmY
MLNSCAQQVRARSAPDVGYRVKLTLNRAPYSILSQLDVDEAEGTVVLSGTVPSYYMKQVAQAIASTVDGVRRLDNQVTVIR